MTGASTYTGATSVNAGVLVLKTTSGGAASLGNSAITVASGATFSPTLGASPSSTVVRAGTTGAGSAGAKLTLNPGSALSMIDGAIGTFDLQENTSFAGAGLVIGGTSGAAPTLAFEIGNAGTGTDQIDVTKNVSVLATGGKITIDLLAGDTSLTAGNYNLITAAGGFSGTGGNGLTLSGTTIALDGTTYSLTLANSTTTREVLSVSLLATPGSSLALEEPDTLAHAPESFFAAPGNAAAGQNITASAMIPALSAPEDIVKPAISTAAVPEPENWASGFAALAAILLIARRSRNRTALRRGFRAETDCHS
jgi:fibronectin-binding autotransporter adhesin